MSESRPGRMRRIVRATLLNGALLAFSLLFAVVVGEIAVRLAAPQQLIILRPDLWQPVDTLGWTRRPNVDLRMNTGERTVRVVSDARGFRVGPDGPVEAGRQVLLLGDSFVEALQVDYEQSFGALLEGSLTRALGEPIAVRNAGINGWGPSQYLLEAKRRLAEDRYDLVITIVYVGNDALPQRADHFPPRQYAGRSRFRMPHSLAPRELVEAWLHPLNDALEVRSHLFVLLKNKLETLRMRAGVSAVYFPPEFLKSQAGSPRWSVTADVCRDIAAAAQEHGARALFVLVPPNFQVNRAKFDQYVAGFGMDTAAVDLEQPTRLLLRELNARGVEVIDALPGFRAAHERGLVLYGSVDPHLSPEGHRTLAEIIAPKSADLMSGVVE